MTTINQGKELASVMRSLVDDLGGESEVTAGQRILLSSIRSKIIIIKQIGDYLDEKISILSEEGELLPCLKAHYTTYTESLRRDIETVYKLAEKKPQKAMDLQSYLDKSYGNDKQGKQ